MKKIFFVILSLLLISTSIGLSAGSDSSDEVAKPSSYSKILKLIKKEQFGEAIKILENILSKSKYQKDPDILNHYAFSLRKTKQLEKAEEYYKKALAIDPEHRGALEYIGELYVDTNRIDLAKKVLQKLEKCRCPEFAELQSYINK
jgi:tetratricopeptide (TPR) repeat protein